MKILMEKTIIRVIIYIAAFAAGWGIVRLVFGREGLGVRERDGKSNRWLYFLFGSLTIVWAIFLILAITEKKIGGILASCIYPVFIAVLTVIVRKNAKKRIEEEEDLREALKNGSYAERFVDKRFAFDTLKNELIAFAPELQREAFARYLMNFDLKEAQVIDAFTLGKNDEQAAIIMRTCGLLGVSSAAGRIEYVPVAANGADACKEYIDLFNQLNYKMQFKQLDSFADDKGFYYIE